MISQMSEPRTLRELNEIITACTKCPRLTVYREQVAREKKRMYRGDEYWGKPVPGWGDPAARVYILGLAPAAHGGNRTGRVFTSDDHEELVVRPKDVQDNATPSGGAMSTMVLMKLAAYTRHPGYMAAAEGAVAPFQPRLRKRQRGLRGGCVH